MSSSVPALAPLVMRSLPSSGLLLAGGGVEAVAACTCDSNAAPYWPGFRIMVFSKSSPALASASYFSVLRPIVMTSPWLSGCLVIVLPLTCVPLVESRSSRNESLRMVMTAAWRPDRSEEHTSELQSLMHHSYAVF